MQPIAATMVLAVVFLGTLLTDRPIIARLAVDFCPLSPEVAVRPAVIQLFRELTVMWAAVHVVNAAATFAPLYKRANRHLHRDQDRGLCGHLVMCCRRDGRCAQRWHRPARAARLRPRWLVQSSNWGLSAADSEAHSPVRRMGGCEPSLLPPTARLPPRSMPRFGRQQTLRLPMRMGIATGATAVATCHALLLHCRREPGILCSWLKQPPTPAPPSAREQR